MATFQLILVCGINACALKCPPECQLTYLEKMDSWIVLAAYEEGFCLGLKL